MNPTTEIQTSPNDDFFKLYLNQRQSLHSHLIQQLLAKSEMKKHLVAQQAADMVEKFLDYRDEFLGNLPPQLKSMSVKEYVTKYDADFLKCIRAIKPEEKITYPEKLQLPLPEELVSNVILQNQPLTEIENQERSNSLQAQEDSIHEVFNNLDPFKDVQNKEEKKSKANENKKGEAKKKRKREQIEPLSKENLEVFVMPKPAVNRTPTGNKTLPTWSANKILNLIKARDSFSKQSKTNAPACPLSQPRLSINQQNKMMVSPARKPWMP